MDDLNLIPVAGYRYCTQCLSPYPERFSCCPACEELSSAVSSVAGSWTTGLSSWAERWASEIDQLKTLLQEIEQHYADDPALVARASAIVVSQTLERAKRFYGAQTPRTRNF